MTTQRIASLDQYRGYCVLGMFVVNFLSSFTITHHLFKHNDTHFSLADSIMPGFILICGFSFRMTFLKRLNNQRASQVRWGFFWRGLGLITLSLVFFGLNGNKFNNYADVGWSKLALITLSILKKDLWEVLAIIGACQIMLLPMIAWKSRSRLCVFVLLGFSHWILSGWFNWNFVYGLPNRLDQLLGTSGQRAWDGGFFGLLAWSQVMLLGTLILDWTDGLNRHQSMWRLFRLGLLLMLLGYGASCMTRLYDIQPEVAAVVPEFQVERNVNDAEIQSPVFPPLAKLSGRNWSTLFAEPPFVPPPTREFRQPNYWAMNKRVVSQSFVLFASGFAILIYAIFIAVGDVYGLSLGILNTLGQNPLVAYLIHHIAQETLVALFPKDSTALWASCGVLLSIVITYKFVRFLEERELYLRL